VFTPTVEIFFTRVFNQIILNNVIFKVVSKISLQISICVV